MSHLPIKFHEYSWVPLPTYQSMSPYQHLPIPIYLFIIAADPGAGIDLVITRIGSSKGRILKFEHKLR